MWATNLKVLVVVLGTLGLYTLVANSIPQVASEVPEELSFEAGDFDLGVLIAAGQELYEGAGGCTACHAGERAPVLVTDFQGEGPIGQRCGDRVPGQDCKTYLHASLVDPGAHLVDGYPPIMPEADRTLSETQIWALVAFMEAQGGEVTVTAEDLETASGDGGGTGSGAGAAAPAAAPAAAAGGMDPVELLRGNLCLSCHVHQGEGVELGPPLDGIGGRMAAARIRAEILDPGAAVSPGYEPMLGVMPATFGQQFTAAQLEVLVEYLAGLR